MDINKDRLLNSSSRFFRPCRKCAERREKMREWLKNRYEKKSNPNKVDSSKLRRIEDV